VNFDPRALALAIAFAGPSQILAGSDYPHLIGSIPMMQSSVTGLSVTAEEQSDIAGGNAARVYGLATAGYAS
jgi:aminocarboxymuconate-semialdehyde decarboxylase